ncbi:hypothetical protein G6F56_012263 [Rhizopus delemar]|nr:hypothetical protein G6F56_012263 [Rhizopus delemar]
MPPAFQPPYSVPVPGAVKKEGESVPYRHFKFADKLVDHPEGVLTAWDLYDHGYKLAGDKPFMGTRRIEDGVAKEYVWQSHPEVRARILNFGKGLIQLGLKHQEAIGVYSVNKPEWTITELSSYRESFIIVALYDTLGAEAMEYIVNQTDMEYIVLSADKLDNIIQLKAQIATIHTAIVMDSTIDDAKKEEAKAAGLKVYTFSEVETIGSSSTTESELPKPQDIATICYTRYILKI